MPKRRSQARSWNSRGCIVALRSGGEHRAQEVVAGADAADVVVAPDQPDALCLLADGVEEVQVILDVAGRAARVAQQAIVIGAEDDHVVEGLGNADELVDGEHGRRDALEQGLKRTADQGAAHALTGEQFPERALKGIWRDVEADEAEHRFGVSDQVEEGEALDAVVFVVGEAQAMGVGDPEQEFGKTVIEALVLACLVADQGFGKFDGPLGERARRWLGVGDDGARNRADFAD